MVQKPNDIEYVDVQMRPDDRNLPIERVGVKNLLYPVSILEKGGGMQHTVARVDMLVGLPQYFKGTHMSRFVAILNEFRGRIEMRVMGGLLREMKDRLQAEAAKIELRFPYFIEKHAPVTGVAGLMDYECSYTGSINAEDEVEIRYGAKVPVTTVCPCSQEISDRGAHNQRSIVTLNVKTRHRIWLEDLIRIVEESGSCELFSHLKRPDEKWCTERAYDRPRFVEDLVRETAAKLRDDDNVVWLKVEAESIESIHNHDAYALIELDKRAAPETAAPK